MALPTWTGIALAVTRMILAILALSLILPRRERFGRRMGAVLTLCVVTCAVCIWCCYFVCPALSTTYQPLSQLVAFTLLILVFIPLLQFCYDVSPSTAAACSATGYLIQNLSQRLFSLVDLGAARLNISEVNSLVRFLMEFVVLAVMLLVIYRVISSRRAMLVQSAENHGAMALVVVMVAVVCIASDIARKNAGIANPVYNFTLIFAHTLVCLAILFMEYEMLYNHSLEVEVATTQAMITNRSRQYELSRESVEKINAMCHDLRHEISRIRELEGSAGRERLDALGKELDVYDATIHTGNDALDTILTEEELLCLREGISLSCIADGHALDFMSQADVYALFGNALDNAITATRAIADASARSISLVVRRSGEMVSAHIENYYEGTIVFQDGIPQTTASDGLNHGVGIKSMLQLLSSYDGTLTTSASKGIFHLNLMIPIPETE